MAYLGGVLDIFWLTSLIEWGAGDAASFPADGGYIPLHIFVQLFNVHRELYCGLIEAVVFI